MNVSRILRAADHPYLFGKGGRMVGKLLLPSLNPFLFLLVIQNKTKPKLHKLPVNIYTIISHC